MKSKGFTEQLRKSAKLNRSIVLPSGQRTNRTWPLCMTCFKEVSACELRDVSPTGCEIWARCDHGTGTDHEDYHRVKFPARTDGDPLADDRNNWQLKRAMHDACFFEPEHRFDSSRRT